MSEPADQKLESFSFQAEVVQILHAVMLAGAPYTLLKGAIYIHPTLAEGLWTLMEAVTPD